MFSDMKYFSADLHLFHDAILQYCDRPFVNVEQMWRAIKRNWNNTVQQNDEVYIIGDLTLKGINFKHVLTEMIGQLAGTKHLIIAPTHDLLRPRDYEEIGFQTIHYPVLQLPNGWYLAHDPAVATALPDNSILVCGHVHQLFSFITNPKGVKIINVGVDVRSFTLVSEYNIETIINEN